MDCVLIMSTGPFELKVGEEKPFSFCVIMGADSLDLENEYVIMVPVIAPMRNAPNSP